MALEYDVLKLLQEAYPEPIYSVVKHTGRNEERWLPDFEVMKGKEVLLAIEVKDTKPSSSIATFDSQMKRAFAVLALFRVRNENVTPFLVLPDDAYPPQKYENIFLAIDCPIIKKNEISELRRDWN